MKEWFKKQYLWLRSFYFIEEGGKEVFDTKRMKYHASIIVGLIILLQIFSSEDESILGKSFRPFDKSESSQKMSKVGDAEALVTAHEKEALAQGRVVKTGVSFRPTKISYNARQVFERTEAQGLTTPIPSGTNFVGKLVNGIDTRQENQTLKVILPYGGGHPSGGSIPRHSVLLGNASYAGGDRVQIRFNRIVYPSGEEFRIDALALSSGDYTPGLIGEHHSETDMRVAGSLGLTIVSAAADVLTQRTAFGGNPYGMGFAQPSATMRNAGLQGVSQVSKQEAEKIGSKMQSKEEYLTVHSGGDLIVGLLTPFKGEAL